MTSDQVASALTGAALGPALGAGLVLAAWLVSSIRDGVPIRQQLMHAAVTLRPVLVGGVGAAGIALLAGQPWQLALAAGISAALTAAGFRAPRP